ncbi:MAG: type VI secretion system baseplate subunit TssG [Aureliella sp.]
MEPNASSDTLPTTALAAPRPLPARSVPFFATMRKLQSVNAALVGRDTRPANEPVRLRAEASQAYPSTELAKATTDKNGRLTLEVSFLGLFGPSGALPQHYTQAIIDRLRHKDHALRDFLDLFNHRWLSLFYRAWEKHDYAAAYQTAHSLGQEDAVTRILWCLIGLGTSGLRGRLRLEDKSLLYYAGLLADVRSRQSTLANILSDWFQIPVQVLQFHGQWLAISLAEQSRMQFSKLGEQSHNQLGVDAVVGERVWNVENRFRIRIGALSHLEFTRYSPLADRLPALHALARTYVGPQLEFDVQAVVQRDQVPSIRLGNESAPSCLGWNTWLGNWPFDHDAQDAVFELADTETLSTHA